MSKEKQIKELAKCLCERSGCHHLCRDTDKCIVEEEAKAILDKYELVPKRNELPSMLTNEEKVSEKGKQIEGEWIVDAWDGEEWVIVPYIKTQHTDTFCSVCYGYALHNDEGEEIASAFCPHCGAKMKGGEE